MVSLPNIICFCILIFLAKTVHSRQSYDKSDCSSQSQISGSNYLCSSRFPCDTYIVYRAQKNFQSLSSVSSLFHLGLDKLLDINKMIKADANNITIGQEIIIPIRCSCTGRFSQAIVMYNFSNSDSFASVACGVFEGLVKALSLAEENPGDPHQSTIRVPVRCACPDADDRRNGVEYLVTYPVIEYDNADLIAAKFGVPETMIWEANKLASFSTIFPGTTLLIPTKDVPFVNSVINADPAPSPTEVIPLKKVTSSTETTILHRQLVLGVGIIAAVILMIMPFSAFICIRIKNHPRNFQPLSARSSASSNLSPDFLDGVSKLKSSLVNYSLEELRIATEDFNEASVIGKALYRGRIDGLNVAVKHMSSEDAARHIISILTKINHLNVLRLEGCCYGSTPYLVFEFAENGSLKDCLSNAKMSKQLTWAKRMQIAFDLAVAIHYIHYCTKPAYVHRNIDSTSALITMDWRAKISGFSLAKPLIWSNEKEETNWNESVVVGTEGYLAPEYLSDGIASLKVDVFAYGVVLLELISAKEVTVGGNFLKDSVNFLEDAGFETSSGSVDELKKFMDPNLEGDYQLGEAMCLALLAKACIQNDPLHRPTMNDVLKALSRIV